MAGSGGPLDGRIVFVTGSSRGIGRATALRLYEQGARVIAHARASSPETEALMGLLGDRGALVLGDLSAAGGAERVWREALVPFGDIDVLVNNAGAWIASQIGGDEAWRTGWETNVALNLIAPADLCRQALLHYRERGAGTIINLVSRSAHRGDDADHLAYGAAKGGLLALTKGIARGYAREGVLAYAVSPGWVATELAAGVLDQSTLDALPLGEATPAAEVAEVVAFLAGGRVRHVTGATIDITGADYVR